MPNEDKIVLSPEDEAVLVGETSTPTVDEVLEPNTETNEESVEETTEENTEQETIDNQQATEDNTQEESDESTETTQEENEESDNSGDVDVPQVVAQEQTTDSTHKEETTEPEKVLIKKFKTPLHAAINKYIEENGDEGVDSFIRTYNSTFEGLDPVGMIRMNLMSDPDNEGLSKKALDRLVDTTLEKYNLDSDDPDEQEIGKELLQRDANKIKNQLIAKRDELRAKYESPLEVEEVNNEPKVPTEEEVAQQRDALVKQYTPKIEQFVRDGFLKLQDKDGEIKIPVKDTATIVEAAVDPVSFLRNAVLNDSNEVDFAKFSELALFISNPSEFKSTLIKYAKGIGKDTVVAEIKNAKPLIQNRSVDDKNKQDPNLDPEAFMKALEKSLSTAR